MDIWPFWQIFTGNLPWPPKQCWKVLKHYFMKPWDALYHLPKKNQGYNVVMALLMNKHPAANPLIYVWLLYSHLVPIMSLGFHFSLSFTFPSIMSLNYVPFQGFFQDVLLDLVGVTTIPSAHDARFMRKRHLNNQGFLAIVRWGL